MFFIALLGQETFTKLKVLASPTTVNDLTLNAIVQFLTQNFHLATIVFKQNQKESESATKYMWQLHRLGRTDNFGMYLETALWDQFVCGLSDVKYQRDLLCDAALTAETTLKKARASEVVFKETEEMHAVKETVNCATIIAATNVSKTITMVC